MMVMSAVIVSFSVMIVFVSITPENKENKDNRLVKDMYVSVIISAAHYYYYY